MASRYFKLEGETYNDTRQLHYVLPTFTFYPTKESNPPLPDFNGGDYDKSFNFKQFWIFNGVMEDGGCVVYTREEVEASDFEDFVPEELWQQRYGMAAAPVVTELAPEEYARYINKTSTNAFLSYSWDITVFNYEEPE